MQRYAAAAAALREREEEEPDQGEVDELVEALHTAGLLEHTEAREVDERALQTGVASLFGAWLHTHGGAEDLHALAANLEVPCPPYAAPLSLPTSPLVEYSWAHDPSGPH